MYLESTIRHARALSDESSRYILCISIRDEIKYSIFLSVGNFVIVHVTSCISFAGTIKDVKEEKFARLDGSL